jgi:DUF1365 family protein
MKSLEILFAKVGHRRLFPKSNEFLYDVFYVVTPITEVSPTPPRFLSINRFNLTSIFTKDHGAHNETAWRSWIVSQCAHRNIKICSEDVVVLISHPRVFGYVFNPISFWLVFEKNSYLKAVLCEVRNTFGDNHNYLLAHDTNRAILASDIFRATKGLYVSPFNKVEHGRYQFSFDVTSSKFKTTIDYFEKDVHILEVFMEGIRKPLTTARILIALLRYPLMTVMIVYRIHRQAVRLYLKGVKNTLAHRPDPTDGKTTHNDTA